MMIPSGGVDQRISEYYKVARAAAKDLNAPHAFALAESQLEFIYNVLGALHALREEAPPLQQSARDRHLKKFDEIARRYGDEKMQQALSKAATIQAITTAMGNASIGGAKLPPPLVGLISSYEENSEDASQSILRQKALLNVLAGNTSEKARKIVRDAHEVRLLANRAALTAVESICEGGAATPNAQQIDLLAHVHYVEELNELLKKCKSPETLSHIIAFLIGHCPDLRRLNFSECTILTPEHLRTLSKFKALDTLSLMETNIDDTHVAALAGLPLKSCDLSNTRITGSTLHTLHREIEDLELVDCQQLTDAGVEGLGRKLDDKGQVLHEAMQLKRCDLDSTSITGSTLHTFHRGIEDLSLIRCKQLTDAGVEGLGRKLDDKGQVLHEAMQLRRCILSLTPITGSTFHTLHRGIEDLRLTYCRQLTDAGVEGLGRKLDDKGQVLHEAMQLKRFWLRCSSITGSTLHSLYRRIEDLGLEGCQQLTDEGVEGLGQKLDDKRQVLREAMQLRRCDLGSTSITGSTLHTLHRGIEYLGLTHCQQLTDAGVEGLGRKLDDKGQVLREAIQLKECILPGQISQALKKQFARAG